MKTLKMNANLPKKNMDKVIWSIKWILRKKKIKIF